MQPIGKMRLSLMAMLGRHYRPLRHRLIAHCNYRFDTFNQIDYFMSDGEAQTPLQVIRGASLGGRSGESTVHGNSLTKWTRFGPDGTGDAASGVEAFPTRLFTRR